jgi:CBS domain-containing protein
MEQIMSTPKTNDISSASTDNSNNNSSALRPILKKNNQAQLSVMEAVLDTSKFPIVGSKTLLKEALDQMSQMNLGIACLLDDNGCLAGVITDGDIRRKLLKSQKPLSAFFVDDAIDHAIKNPSVETLDVAVELMAQKKVWDLPVVAIDGTLVGLLHLHPAVMALLKSKNHE